MKIISEYKTEPYIIHLPGKSWDFHLKSFVKPFMEEMKNVPIKISSNISIICLATKSYQESPLMDQFKISNISFFNSANSEDETTWYNEKKIDLIIKDLSKIKTEYTLILDSRDVLLVKDIDESFIEEFKKLNADIVYNAGRNFFPKLGAIRWKLDDLIFSNTAYKFLNAGVCFGKTEKLKEFYSTASKIFERHPFFEKSEQYYIHLAFLKNKNVKVNIDVFQNLFGCVKPVKWQKKFLFFKFKGVSSGFKKKKKDWFVKPIPSWLIVKEK